MYQALTALGRALVRVQRMEHAAATLAAQGPPLASRDRSVTNEKVSGSRRDGTRGIPTTLVMTATTVG